MAFRFRKPTDVLKVLRVMNPTPPTPPTPTPEVAPLRITNTGSDETKISFVDTWAVGTSLRVSVNGGEFQPWDLSEIILPPGEYMEFAGNNETLHSELGIGHFVGNPSPGAQVDCRLSGSVMSLIYGEMLTEQQNLIMPSNLSLAYLFYDFNLSTAPELPATTLSDFAYAYMFNKCVELRAAPDLPATTPTTQCYLCMFRGCAKLNSININLQSWGNDLDACLYWINGVSVTGTFTKPASLPTEYGGSRIPSGWTVIDKE